MVEQGNFPTSAQTDYADEIGELERRFAKMLNSIKALIDEVYQSKIDGKNAELRALQAQINPHFLYNSLSIINWKAIESENHEISRIINLLSVFYRTSLNQGNNAIRVSDELENTKSYIEIQLIMHDHSFDVIYSIEHGIDQKRDGRGGIRVTAELDGSYIVFKVEDNSPGMKDMVKDMEYLYRVVWE